jgi:NAD(P)-dependent dehydrogenase (short-subunit alcohol dehydrogenase family)
VKVLKCGHRHTLSVSSEYVVCVRCDIPEERAGTVTHLVQDVDRMFSTNVQGLIYMTRQILPGMVARNHGHIFNISSVAGHESYGGGAIYCATKHAVRAFTDSLRHDVVDTQVCPAVPDTSCMPVLHAAVASASAHPGQSGGVPVSASVAGALALDTCRPPALYGVVLSAEWPILSEVRIRALTGQDARIVFQCRLSGT